MLLLLQPSLSLAELDVAVVLGAVPCELAWRVDVDMIVCPGCYASIVSFVASKFTVPLVSCKKAGDVTRSPLSRQSRYRPLAATSSLQIHGF